MNMLVQESIDKEIIRAIGAGMPPQRIPLPMLELPAL